MTRGANEIAEHRDVGSVGADPASVYWQTEAFREIKIHSGIIQLGQTETRSGLHAVHARRVDGSRGTVTLPRTARQLIELFPIAFVPSVHRYSSSPFL
jgi:hypothetical protein